MRHVSVRHRSHAGSENHAAFPRRDHDPRRVFCAQEGPQHLSVLGHGGVHRVFHVGFASHVAVHVGYGVVSYFVADGAAQLVLDIRNDDLRPVPGKKPRRTFANPAGAARYHSNFAR
nr:hypothetical protein Itr_chr04CG11620 [Ipomoea trifida]